MLLLRSPKEKNLKFRSLTPKVHPDDDNIVVETYHTFILHQSS